MAAAIAVGEGSAAMAEPAPCNCIRPSFELAPRGPSVEPGAPVTVTLRAPRPTGLTLAVRDRGRTLGAAVDVTERGERIEVRARPRTPWPTGRWLTVVLIERAPLSRATVVGRLWVGGGAPATP